MLKHRVISSTLIISCLVGIYLFAPAWALMGIIAAIALAGLYEFYGLLGHAGLPVLRVPGLAAGGLLCLGMWMPLCPLQHAGQFQVALAWTALLVIGLLLCQLFSPDMEKALEKLGGTVLGLLYVPLLMGFFGFLIAGWQVDADGRLLVIYLIAVVKATDMGAYFIGSAIGKRKLFPRISPAKSWEGCAGGVGVAVGVSLIFYFAGGGELGVVRLCLRDALILPVLLSITGILGDLVESMMKRAANLKDSSRAVAGMGGILDIIDSLLPAAPVLYWYAYLFLEPS